MDNVELRGVSGTIHFIRFPTSQMKRFLSLANQKGMAKLISTVCATGGGAYKFEADFKKVCRIFQVRTLKNSNGQFFSR